jgi:DNA-binding transcriptional ArsR family regulator
MNSTNELNQNLWERFGFSGDPFETGPLPLTYGSGLSVERAYIPRKGRVNPGTLLRNFLKNPGGGRIVVEGEPGVGKTTFVNFHRFEWERRAKPPLLSPVTHISVQSKWDENDFLLSLLSALSARIRLELKPNAIARDALLKEVTAITGVRHERDGSIGFSASIAGFGGGVSKSGRSSLHTGKITTLDLREYLTLMVNRVREKLGFGGIIFHLDNLELLKRNGESGLREFFEDIRDSIQEPHVYFVFVGYTGMFQNVIAPSSRVRSIFFDKPLHLAPLPLEQVHELVNLRYELLSIKGKHFIRPIEDAVIDHLYALFEAKIRPIMNAVTSLVSHLPDSVAETLALEEATELLYDIQLSEVETRLTKAELEVFLEAARLKQFTPTALVKATGKSKQLIQKHLKKLLEIHYIQQDRKDGRSQYYSVDARFHVLNKPSS